MKNLFCISIIAFLLVGACSQPTTKKSEPAPQFNLELTKAEKDGGVLTPEILWKFRRISDPQLSPDGTNVLFGVSEYDVPTNKSRTTIYMIPMKGGEPKKMLDLAGSQFNQRWIGTDLFAFVSTHEGDAQVYKAKVGSGSVEKVTNFETGINSFEYSPDSKKILFTSEVKVVKDISDKHPDLPLVEVYAADDLMYRHWNHWNDASFSHVFYAQVGNGVIKKATDIMKGEPWDAPMSPYFDNTEMTWSPDGNTIAYTCKKLVGKNAAVSTNSDIYLYDLIGGGTTNITKANKGYDRYPVFSPNGKQIAYQSMETDGYESDKNCLFIYNAETKMAENYSVNYEENISGVQWAEDGETIFFVSGINATYQLYKMALNTKKVDQITSGHHNYQSVIVNGNELLGAKMKHSMATELFTVNAKTGEERQLTHINKHIYEYITMGRSEERWVETTDGKKMLVWVIYPPKFDENKQYPALLYCQGGPQSAVSQFFSYRWNFQMMAANDYVIIAPNRRGLPTFGQEWNRQISGDYSGQNIEDYLAAVDAIKTEPFIDEKRIGAIGASYGGYSVYYLAGHHEGRFSAFISHCGMFNFESFYAATEETFFPNHDLGGAYWEENNKVAQRSYENSPHKFVKNWDTPILIISGGKDFRIPYTESLQAFNAAQLNGVESRLLIFPNESHFVLKPQNSILWQREFFGWLDKYLK
ncbi:MAG: S9 family peptidase [Salinivirgaceae bacterium]|jgi:dipeptidyl aminopeptidase/acylaminoacyl peptidase|nr:S9 family peptidase [Salinivirgaceae bacterium]